MPANTPNGWPYILPADNVTDYPVTDQAKANKARRGRPVRVRVWPGVDRHWDRRRVRDPTRHFPAGPVHPGADRHDGPRRRRRPVGIAAGTITKRRFRPHREHRRRQHGLERHKRASNWIAMQFSPTSTATPGVTSLTADGELSRPSRSSDLVDGVGLDAGLVASCSPASRSGSSSPYGRSSAGSAGRPRRLRGTRADERAAPLPAPAQSDPDPAAAADPGSQAVEAAPADDLLRAVVKGSHRRTIRRTIGSTSDPIHRRASTSADERKPLQRMDKRRHGRARTTRGRTSLAFLGVRGSQVQILSARPVKPQVRGTIGARRRRTIPERGGPFRRTIRPPEARE